MTMFAGDLKTSGFPQLVTFGETLDSPAAEIATMWRFSRNNGTTEGFHPKREVLQSQAYGFRISTTIGCGFR